MSARQDQEILPPSVRPAGPRLAAAAADGTGGRALRDSSLSVLGVGQGAYDEVLRQTGLLGGRRSVQLRRRE